MGICLRGSPSFTCAIGKENVCYQNRVIALALNLLFLLKLIGVFFIIIKKEGAGHL